MLLGSFQGKCEVVGPEVRPLISVSIIVLSLFPESRISIA
jgi:hypothetical protein